LDSEYEHTRDPERYFQKPSIRSPECHFYSLSLVRQVTNSVFEERRIGSYSSMHNKRAQKGKKLVSIVCGVHPPYMFI
jgi:hypothetical protein